ncbi:MAG: alpha-L-rhamnosidase N-terminal domain-containing protein [Candidatus Omnitrophota bacterium]
MRNKIIQNPSSPITRRNFIKNSAAVSGVWALNATQAEADNADGFRFTPAGSPTIPSPPLPLPDLSPAKWLWHPSGRCLQNTFILFRRTLSLAAKPKRATGWISADSRYLLNVNGQRIHWGPAPCDPRFLEADPIDLTNSLQAGENVIGAQVLFYGQGEGTWPTGKPGFLFYLEIEDANGHIEIIVSDASWRSFLARAWKPGQYKRWYLRCLQEEFDARLYPYGWTEKGFAAGPDWLEAMILDCSADKPPICSTYTEYMLDMRGDPQQSQLRARTIPPMKEFLVPVKQLTESCWIEWKRPAQDYFDFLIPDAFDSDRTASASITADGAWIVPMNSDRAAALTFELEEQIVGWPYFTIEAPEGTIIELMPHEAHQPGGLALLNTHHHSWSRFICREGENRFETFDYESLRWLQLHIRNARGEIKVKNVGARRRIYPWPHQPQIACTDSGLQKLIGATVNTLNNCAQETLVDGMGRERQQYSGDCGHQIHAIYSAFGETKQLARYITTYSQGITLDGYFLDSWPAYDRLARLMERQLYLSGWGSILDHGVGFNFDCYYYYLYTGDKKTLEEPYPRLLRFADYLKSIQGKDNLLPVENIGSPCVWIDHIAYKRQRHKQCAFNLYAAAMLEHALAPICKVFGEETREQEAILFGRELLLAAIQHFWDGERKIFVNNLPWRQEEKEIRLCDRSLATAILFDQCPQEDAQASLKALAECPPDMGFSYPANAGWRLWALAKGGRPDIVLKDLRGRWLEMESVALNNSLQEDWHARPDSGSQWSHCPVVPLYVLTMSLAGIRPLTPGYTRCEIRPQLADLESLDLTAQTIQGPIRLQSKGKIGNREIAIALPPNCEGELVVLEDEKIALPRISGKNPAGCSRYQLPAGKTSVVKLMTSC